MLTLESVQKFVDACRAITGQPESCVVREVLFPRRMEWFSCLATALGVCGGPDENYQALLNMQLSVPNLFAAEKWNVQHVSLGACIESFFRAHEDMTLEMKYLFTDRDERSMSECFEKCGEFMKENVFPKSFAVVCVKDGDNPADYVPFGRRGTAMRGVLGFVFEKGLGDVPPMKLPFLENDVYSLKSFIVWVDGCFRLVIADSVRPCVVGSRATQYVSAKPELLDHGIVVFALYTLGALKPVSYEGIHEGPGGSLFWPECVTVASDFLGKNEMTGLKLVEECIANFDLYICRFLGDKTWNDWAKGITNPRALVKPDNLKQTLMGWASHIIIANTLKDSLDEMVKHLQYAHSLCIPELKGQHAVCYAMLKVAVKRMTETPNVDYLKSAILMFGTECVGAVLEEAGLDVPDVSGWKASGNDYPRYLPRALAPVTLGPRRLSEALVDAVRDVLETFGGNLEDLIEYEQIAPTPAFYEYLKRLT